MLRDSPLRPFSNPYEEALNEYCNKRLKSILFKGSYKERCYVEEVNGYRDLIVVNPGEKELKVILEDIRSKLVQSYLNQSIWIGITLTPLSKKSLETCIWAELDDLSFGQYWFSIKSLRMRDNEIIVKLKPVGARGYIQHHLRQWSNEGVRLYRLARLSTNRNWFGTEYKMHDLPIHVERHVKGPSKDGGKISECQKCKFCKANLTHSKSI